MKKADNIDHGSQEEHRFSLEDGSSVELGKGRASLDSEILIKKAFEIHTNRGIELLFRYYYHSLCSHAIRYVSSKEIAEDIVSDIFYKFQAEEVFRQVQTSYRAYLFTSVRHRAFDYIRAEMTRNTSIHSADYVPIQADQQPDQLTQYEDLYNDVENAVNSLPLQRRRIYVMHRFEGKKYQEIAKELGLSLRTVEGQMYQALHQVRKIIKARWFLAFLIFLD